MSNKTRFADALQRVIFLEETMSEFCQLRDDAFEVFENYTTLDQMLKIFDTSWKKLFSWNTVHEHDGIPELFIQDFYQVRAKFYDLTTAKINRNEFENALCASQAAIDEYIEEFRHILSEENLKLSVLYNEFATKRTGALKFLFETPEIKKLIMDNLLKS